MRIAVGGFHHETNTFAPSKAEWKDFLMEDSWPGLLRGAEIASGCAGINLSMAGFLEEAERQGWEIAPLLWCSANPSSYVREEAFERIMGMLSEDLRKVAGEVDAVYLDLHGAMVCEHLDDGDGEILRRVREMVGADVPIVANLDFHANVTAAMVEHADGLLIYRTYPHVDMTATGARAGRFLARMLSGEGRPAKAWAPLDFLVPLPWQCTDMEPAKSLYEHVAAESEVGEVWELSLAMGFPLADIPHCGPSVVAYGANAAAAQAACDALAHRVRESESAFRGRIWSPAEALDYVAERLRAGERGPFVLADCQDNPGAGANSDTVGLLRAMLERKDGMRCALGLLYDPGMAAEIVATLGEGGSGEMRLRLGAKSGVGGETPVEEVFEVETCGSDARIRGTGAFYGGALLCLGAHALARRGEVRVVVCSSKIQCADREIFAHYGVEVSELDAVGVKSSVHFRADFDAVAREVLVVASPGPAHVDLGDLPYAKLRPGVRTMPGGG